MQPVWKNITLKVLKDSSTSGLLESWALAAEVASGFCQEISIYLLLNQASHPEPAIFVSWLKLYEIPLTSANWQANSRTQQVKPNVLVSKNR